jgi:hypothetical protein
MDRLWKSGDGEGKVLKPGSAALLPQILPTFAFLKQRLVLTGYDEWSNSGLCLRGVACPELYLVNKELLVNPALTPSSYSLIESCT